ncbi:MAG TPA: hypothetical protein VMD02_05690 [Candidatus Omnitrophota bacterium]|nr:hypothetical protein [Candidatus Omnitrophota bacterium]
MDRSKLSLLFLVSLLLCTASFASVRTGTIVAAPVTVGDSTNTFPTAYEDEINGGYKIVSNEATMNSIPASRRVVGMLCYVSSEATTFRLNGSNAWVAESSSAKGGGWISGGGRVTLETISNNVGIGVSNPAGMLEVANYNGGDPLLRLSGNAASSNDLAQIGDINSAGNGEVLTINGATANMYYIGGKVGIGNTKPDGALDVGNSHTFVVNGSKGNVGIGITAPIATLEVNGDVMISASPTPSDHSAGRIYLSSATNRLNYSDGNKWIEIDPAYTTNEVMITEVRNGSTSGSHTTDSVSFTTINASNGIIITGVSGTIYAASENYSNSFLVQVTNAGSTTYANFRIGSFASGNSGSNDTEAFYCPLPIPTKVPGSTSIPLGITITGTTNFYMQGLSIQYIVLPL